MERVDNEVLVLCGGEWIQIAAPARPGIPAVSCHGDETTRPLSLTVTPRATEGPAGLVSIWQELCFPDRPWQPALFLSLLFPSSHPCFRSLFCSAWRDDTALFSSSAQCAHTSILMGSVAPLLYIPGTFLLTHTLIQTHEIRVVKSWTTLPWDCKARLLLMTANVCFPQFAYLTQVANKANLKMEEWLSQKQDQVVFRITFKGGRSFNVLHKENYAPFLNFIWIYQDSFNLCFQNVVSGWI